MSISPPLALDKNVGAFLGWKYSTGVKEAIEYDEIAFWNRYLDENEIKKIYTVKKNVI